VADYASSMNFDDSNGPGSYAYLVL